MTILVDLDGVICTEKKTFERSLAKVMPGAQKAMQDLHQAGHTVVVYTARSWAELSMTKKWLEDNGIPYDGLHMGKPVADITLDDRAICFENWDSARLQLSLRGAQGISASSSCVPTYPVDEEFLGENRRAIHEFLHWLAQQDLPEPILEVGPMVDERNVTRSVLHQFPQFYVDTRDLFKSAGKEYYSLDVNPATKPDYLCDVSELDQIVTANSVGTVIMLSVLEHVQRVWHVADAVSRVLKPNGLLGLQTPWNLRFHDPRPDCWRISDDGYHALFDQNFEFLRLDRIETRGRDLMPVCFTAFLRKKP